MSNEYQVVAVSRAPHQATGPTLVELGPIVVPRITYETVLNGDSRIQLSTNPDKLEDSIASRLRDLRANPTEIIIYKGSDVVEAGPILFAQMQGSTLVLDIRGLLYYLRYMFVTTDLTYTTQDQASVIGKGLVDHWQNLDYGDYGIDTSGIAAHSVLRSRTYIAADHPNIHAKLLELGAVGDGFDVRVDPETRALILANPTAGVDKTASVILDSRNIKSPNIRQSVGAGDIASDSFATGTSFLDDTGVLTASTFDLATRQAWGRAGVAQTFRNVSEQATLDDHAQANLDPRTEQLFLPGPQLFPIADAEVEDIDVGDTIAYNFDAGLGAQTGNFRVGRKRVTVNEDGNESMKVAFL